MMKDMLQRTVIAQGGRNGIIKETSSGVTYTLRKPVEMGGEDHPGTDPEELFAAGYASCLASSIEYLLTADNVSFEDVLVQATNHLLMVPDKGFQFKLEVKTTILGVSSEVEKAYTLKGQAFCPFSRAIQGNVTIENI